VVVDEQFIGHFCPVKVAAGCINEWSIMGDRLKGFSF